MNNAEVLTTAVRVLQTMQGRKLDILTLTKPIDLQSAVGVSKVLSKLSPLVGNTIESIVAQDLNAREGLWPMGTKWLRQDPDFPDVVLDGMPEPRPGFEVKAWMPLATEITGRFRDSQSTLKHHDVKVVVVCWLPELLVAGQPQVLDVFICDAIDVALARDTHYHNPPWYVLREPEDTRTRTRNLQQKNTNAFVFQGTPQQRKEAEAQVASWGPGGKVYRANPKYQALLRDLMSRYEYRAETNFAKMDRIELAHLEEFKARMYDTTFVDRTVRQWREALRKKDSRALAQFVEGGVPEGTLNKPVWDADDDE